MLKQIMAASIFALLAGPVAAQDGGANGGNGGYNEQTGTVPQPNSPQAETAPGTSDVSRNFALADTDEDAVLSEEEAAEVGVVNFDDLDIDGDRRLSDEEFAAWDGRDSTGNVATGQFEDEDTAGTDSDFE